MTTEATEKKKRAAFAALHYLREGMIVGVGTGSTVNEFIAALAQQSIRLKSAVSSSNATTARLSAIGVEVIDLNQAGTLDLYIDGADEATRHRQLIKGGGGALTREKIVAAASRQFVCMVDEGKIVDSLGRFPLPVEVIPMAQSYIAQQLAAVGGRAVLRAGFLTDNGNHILDVHGLAIHDPVALEREINQIAGVVTVGLFAARPADVLLIGTDAAVTIL